MRLAVQVKLLPTPDQAAALKATLRAANSAADHVAQIAFQRRCFSLHDLRKISYGQVRSEYGLASQVAQLVIKRVADAYKSLHSQIASGLLGAPGSRRRVKAESKPVRFRTDAAQTYDDRCLSWLIGRRRVSIWTVHGRMKDIAFTGFGPQLAALATHRGGETDLVHRDGHWFLIATLRVPDPPAADPAGGFLGVDKGIANIATTSDGVRHSGRRTNAVRCRHRRLRARLQAKQTKSARRLLKRRRRKEARFAANTNHVIAKQIVIEAQRTGRGIALEDLRGIRERVRLRTPQRITLHSWSFHQLDAFIGYKAALAGVPVVLVDPAYTSQECSRCGHVDKMNRPDQQTFSCTSCGFAEHADVNAGRVIALRGEAAWAVSHAVDDAARTVEAIDGEEQQAWPRPGPRS